LKPKPLFDVGETGNETRQNCSTFKFIADNALYNIEGQEELMRTFSARDEKLKFPMESMEVKASWRKFTDAEAKTDLVKQYYTFVDGNTVWGLARCRQECGGNWRSAGSENLNIACQAARSIG